MKLAVSGRYDAAPDAAGGGLAEVHLAAGDGDGGGLVVLAVRNAHADSGTQTSLVEKFQKLGVFLVHAEDFHGAPDGQFAEDGGAARTPQARQSAAQGQPMRAGAVGAEAAQQKRLDFGGEAVFETLG